MVSQVDLKDFVAGFVLEAYEHLHSINRNLVAASEALRLGRAEPRAVRELFRSLHTIKGLASMVGAEPIVDLSHEMEGILRAADRGGGRLSENTLDLLLQGTRAIEERVHALSKEGLAAVAAAPPQLIEGLALAQRGGTMEPPVPEARISLPDEITKGLSAADREQLRQASQGRRRAVIVEFHPSPERAARGLNITTVRERLGKLGDLVKVVPRSVQVAPTGIAFALLMVTDAEKRELGEASGMPEESIEEIRVTEAAPARLAPSGPAGPSEASDDWMPGDHSSIRVDIRRLDEALERLSALVVTRSKLMRVSAELAGRGVDVRELNSVLAENARELKRLRAAITDARMVPLAELLQRLPLVVRGLTKDSDKSVNLGIQAGSAEVDKAVADKIFPAVVHLVRNAIDHAIEPRDERARLGKPETATLSVVCDDSSGTSLILKVGDDGRGIDREAVARKLGRPVAGDDEELLRQICAPGLSTREDVTHLSGRGMGMDIVRRAVEMLGGSLSLATAPGRGTMFTLRVPVSVTIVDVLSFVAGEQVYVAPVATIVEIIEIDPSRLTRSPAPAQSQRRGPQARLLQRRGETIPFFALDALLSGSSEERTPTKALVIHGGRSAIAFGVDRMLGQQEVVMRPLNDALVRAIGTAGATDLGDGRPTLVLDLANLASSILQNTG